MTSRPLALALLAALLVPVVAQAQGTPASKVSPSVQRPTAQAVPTQSQAKQPAASQPSASQPGTQSTAPAQVPPAFTAFLQELWPDARAKGVTRATFDMAFAGVTPDPRIMPITQRQPEFGQSVGTYIANFASKSRIETGVAQGCRATPPPSTPSRSDTASTAGSFWRSGAWRPTSAAARTAGTSSARSPRWRMRATAIRSFATSFSAR